MTILIINHAYFYFYNIQIRFKYGGQLFPQGQFTCIIITNMNSEEQHESISSEDEPQQANQEASESQQFNNLAPNSSHQSQHQQEIQQPQKQLSVIRQAKPRLIIQQIILENFKSYADRQTIGPFHQNFTSIVGPNGSGKSNLIESMLFIFGFNASWMRLHRLNQLIHNSATMSNVQRAGVEVHFKKVIDDANGNVVEVTGSEFVVRRSVSTNSTSKYFLDGKETTQAELKLRLMQEGIDLNNNRFLILQGEVEQISQMKQKSGDRDHPGLLQYLQDIIGSNQYLSKIQSSTIEYNQVEQIKHQKGQMMRLVETQLKNISKGKQQAIKFVKKQRKIYQIQNILSQVVVANHSKDIKAASEKLIHYENERDRIIHQERQRMKKQAQRVKEIKKNKQEIEIIQKSLAKEREALEKFSMSDKNINQQISFKSQDTVKYTRKVTELDKELSKVIEESQNIKNMLPKATKDLDQKANELEILSKELAHHDKPHLREKIKELQVQVRRAELHLDTFKQKHSILTQKTQKINEVTSTNSAKNNQNREKLVRSQICLKKISIAQSQAQKVYGNLKDTFKRLSSERIKLKEQLEKIDLSLRQFYSENQEFGQRNNMFQQIMKQKIPGVLGRLGDLGKTTKDYDQIITTVCNRLDNIVVVNFQAANAVIDFLKKTKLGRVSCIILDKITQFANYMRKHFVPLKNAVRLFDMIQPINDEVRVAFYFAISDTLFCEDSDLGLQYAMKDDKQRRKVISRKKNGYIIFHPNGLMNGCLSKRGGFDNKASIFKKDNNQKQAQELQQTKKRMMKECQANEAKIRNVQGELLNVEKDIQQMKKQKQSLEIKIAELREEIKEFSEIIDQQTQKKESNAYEKIRIQLQSLQRQIKTQQNIKNNLEDEQKKVEEEQRKAESQKIHQMRQKYKVCKLEYQKSQKQIEKKRAFLASIVKSVEENKKQKEETTKRIQRLQQEISRLKSQQMDIENKATQIFGRIAAGEEKIKECQQLDKRLRIILQDDQKQVRQSKKKIDNAKHEVDICRQQCKRHQGIIGKAMQQLKKNRQTYEQLTVTYDFMEEIDSIEKMTINQNKGPQRQNTSFLETSTILNMSVDGGGTKAFSLDKLLEISPFQDAIPELLEQYLLFEDRLRSTMVSQMQSLNKLQGNNLSIITQFKMKYKDYQDKTNQFEAVKQRQLDLKRLIDTLKDKRLSLFRQGFGIINAKLKEVYQLLTRGGDAELQLIDSLDPFSDGINFSVRPPKKSWKQINKLSGGEKTLSSLSLIFALHYYKPTPLYFMDEIDAALDFKNVSIVAEYIKKRTKNAQFIIISLRNNMFDLADKLVGVYKTQDKTKVIIFCPNKYRTLKDQQRKDKENQDGNQQNNHA